MYTKYVYVLDIIVYTKCVYVLGIQLHIAVQLTNSAPLLSSWLSVYFPGIPLLYMAVVVPVGFTVIGGNNFLYIDENGTLQAWASFVH